MGVRSVSLANGLRSLIRTITQPSRQTVTCVPRRRAAVIAKSSLTTCACGTLLKAKAAIAHETVTAVVKLIVLSAPATIGDMTINPPCNATVAHGEMRSLAKEDAIAPSVHSLELRAKHRNADADVESDTAIVSPTRVATTKRFMIGPFQFGV